MELGSYTSVTSFSIPSQVTVNTPFNVSIAGHVDNQPPSTWSNFTVAFGYNTGPADSITVTVGGNQYTINKGSAVLFYVTSFSPCTTISETLQVTVPTPGQYSFQALTGHVENGVLYVDSLQSATVSASSQVSPIAPSGVELPSYFWWAVGGLTAAIIALGAFSYLQFIHQQELIKAVKGK